MPAAPEQCVIFVGGRGTRLGELTASTPKPLLDVDGRPFLSYLLHEAARFGFRRVLLLAGYRADAVVGFARENNGVRGLEISVVCEETPLGTGGALWAAADRLDDEFLLLNGDSWLDFNWLAPCQRGLADPSAAMAMALRQVADGGRYGAVTLHNGRVKEFRERGTPGEPALVNGGVYFCRKKFVVTGGTGSSLEQHVLPALAQQGRLVGDEYTGFFIDIGVPESFMAAQTLVPAQQRRPAVFLDRDGVLNHDSGYVCRIDQFAWIDGASKAVRRLNEAGYYVFVVTNQAAVARGYCSIADVEDLHRWMAAELRQYGSHIDDLRYCPFHEQGVVAEFRKPSNWRKPAPGMLLDLMQHWPVDREKSFMIGDKESDHEAARAAGVASYDFPGGNLDRYVEEILANRATPATKQSPAAPAPALPR